MKLVLLVLLAGISAACSFLETVSSAPGIGIRENNRRRISCDGRSQQIFSPVSLTKAYGKNSAPKFSATSLSALNGGSSSFGSENGFVQNKMKDLRQFVSKNFFLIGMFFAVTFARFFPSLGLDGGIFRPELIIGKYGVFFIFLLSGLSLEVSELSRAVANMKLNFLTQFVSFIVWPFCVGLPLVNVIGKQLPALTKTSPLLPQALLDGLLILTCLPTTVNMCIFLTAASGGSVASALCNAAMGNLLGVFATPALLFKFFGASIELPFVAMVLKLCNKVLLPVSIGQLLRSTRAKNVYEQNTKLFKRSQELILLGIVWNAFCNAFSRGFGLDATNVITLLTILPLLHTGSLLGLFSLFKSPFINLSKKEAVAAAFAASHKTLAFGLPLVKTVFEGNPNLASYCAPIMFIHPLQLVIGSFLVPYFSKFTDDKS